MNMALPQTPFWQPLGWTLVHFLWQGASVALAFALAQFALRRSAAQARYLAGCAALLAMAVLPCATFRYELSMTGEGVSRTVSPEPPQANATAAPVSPQSGGDPVLRISMPPPPPSTRGPERSQAETVLPWLVAAWLCGVTALSLRLLAAWLRVQSWKRLPMQPLEPAWLETLRELRGRMGVRKAVRLLKSTLVESPAVLGWLRPVILIPAGALAGLSPAQLEAVLLHELAHIRRHDYLVNLLQSGIETLLFYHPAVWWVSGAIREERENCCDDLAVRFSGDRFDYARALTSLEQLRLTAPPLAMAARGGSLSQRIRRLLGAPREPVSATGWVAGGMAILLLGCFLYASRTNARAAAKEETTPPRQTTPVARPEAPPAGKNGPNSQAEIPVDWAVAKANLARITGGTNSATDDRLKRFLDRLGINAHLGREFAADADLNLAIDEKAGLLRATGRPTEIDRLTKALERLAAPFNQIKLEAKWVEVTTGQHPSNRLDGVLLSPAPPGSGAATAEAQAGGLAPVTKPCQGVALTIQTIGLDKRITNRAATSESRPFTSALRRAEFTNFVFRLESRSGIDLLSAPKVVTITGREARISVEDSKTIVTAVEAAGSAKPTITTKEMMFGPTLNVVPQASADGRRITLAVKGEVNEFQGYHKRDGQGGYQPLADPDQTNSVPALPRFRQRRYEATETVRLGEALAFGGLTTTETFRFVDRVPVLGDIPMLGRMFSKKGSGTHYKTLMLIVTPTLMNSFGDEALPE